MKSYFVTKISTRLSLLTYIFGEIEGHLFISPLVDNFI